SSSNWSSFRTCPSEERATQMRKLLLTSVFCVLFLSVETYSAATTCSPQQGRAVSWTVAMNPQNNKWVRVLVMLHPNFCITPDLSFYFDYLDAWRQRRRLSRGFNILAQDAGDIVCNKTYEDKVFYDDYELDYPASFLLLDSSDLNDVVVTR